MLCQRTVKSVIRASGVGLHSGKKVTLTLRPAAPDTGIMFRRVDLETPVDIKASALTVGDTRMCSCLDVDGVRIGTVEHLMSALCGLGIDNVWIDLDAAEVPILDGSSSPFVFLIQSAGISEQNAPKRFLRIKKPVEVREGDKVASLTPYDGFKLNFSIVFNHPAIDRTGQQVSFDFADQGYTRDIARALVVWRRTQPLAAGSLVCASSQRAGAGRTHQRLGHRHAGTAGRAAAKLQRHGVHRQP